MKFHVEIREYPWNKNTIIITTVMKKKILNPELRNYL